MIGNGRYIIGYINQDNIIFTIIKNGGQNKQELINFFNILDNIKKIKKIIKSNFITKLTIKDQDEIIANYDNINKIKTPYILNINDNIIKFANKYEIKDIYLFKDNKWYKYKSDNKFYYIHFNT